MTRGPSRSKLSRRALIVAATMLSTASLAGCAGSAAPIRIGYQRTGVLLLAKARGRLPDLLDSRVEWVEFPSGPPLMEAMAAGAIDFGAVGDAPAIFAQASGSPVLYAAQQPLTGAASALLVPPGSRLQGPSALRGRRIAFTRGTSAHLFLYFALDQAGLRLTDIQSVLLAPSDAAAAFHSGQFDAWSTWDPYYALAARDQGARAIVSGEMLPRTSSFYLASRRFAEGTPTRLAALLDSLRLEAAWGNANRDAVAGVIASATGIPDDITRIMLRRGLFAVEPLDADTVVRQQTAADAFVAMGELTRSIAVAQAVWRDWTPTPGFHP